MNNKEQFVSFSHYGSHKGFYREDDTGKKMADMRNRCQLINDMDPDLVISIHQNSYQEESIYGGQVF